MESMNYTYERKKVAVSKGWWFNWRGYVQQVFDDKQEVWVIINPKGRKIAEAASEESAALIVSALNGVAV